MRELFAISLLLLCGCQTVEPVNDWVINKSWETDYEYIEIYTLNGRERGTIKSKLVDFTMHWEQPIPEVRQNA